MGASGVLGDALGVRQVFYLSGLITIFAGLLAAILMRSPASMEMDSGLAIKRDTEIISVP